MPAPERMSSIDFASASAPASSGVGGEAHVLASPAATAQRPPARTAVSAEPGADIDRDAIADEADGGRRATDRHEVAGVT